MQRGRAVPEATRDARRNRRLHFWLRMPDPSSPGQRLILQVGRPKEGRGARSKTLAGPRRGKRSAGEASLRRVTSQRPQHQSLKRRSAAGTRFSSAEPLKSSGWTAMKRSPRADSTSKTKCSRPASRSHSAIKNALPEEISWEPTGSRTNCPFARVRAATGVCNRRGPSWCRLGPPTKAKPAAEYA